MITIKTAKQLVNTIRAFNFDKTDEVSRWSLQGCEFTLSHGLIGYVSPFNGWFQVYDFNGSDPRGGTAVENIQWILDEYGNEYTFQILDHAEYSHQELGTYISQPRKDGDRFIGTCREREVVEELVKDGVIKILSVDPLQ
jgi:hypothetical protein|tara:strand:- start:35 stop:454 length:420 start_codon:yes stop_codon:yes gene_type:complete